MWRPRNLPLWLNFVYCGVSYVISKLVPTLSFKLGKIRLVASGHSSCLTWKNAWKKWLYCTLKVCTGIKNILLWIYCIDSSLEKKDSVIDWFKQRMSHILKKLKEMLIFNCTISELNTSVLNIKKIYNDNSQLTLIKEIQYCNFTVQ